MDEASAKEYERLRAHILSGSTLTRPAGLVVLLRHGLAAWRTRRTACAAALAPSPSPAASTLGNDRHAALVPVLVNMVLGTDRQVRV